MPIFYVGLGSNIPPRLDYLRKGIAGIKMLGAAIETISSVYETSPVGNANQEVFLNAVAAGTTRMTPQRLLEGFMEIERSAGRVRLKKWGPRTLDLDLLLYDDAVLQAHGLIVPHPRMTGRKFVLVPLLEISPHLADPSGEPYRAHLEKLGDDQKIKRHRIRWLRT